MSKIRFCCRCEKVRECNQFNRRKNVCLPCVKEDRIQIGDYPYRNFDDLPKGTQKMISYYAEVDANKNYISKKLGIPYTLISKWITCGHVPPYTDKIEVQPKPESDKTDKWTKWFNSLDTKIQKDVVEYLSPKIRTQILSPHRLDPVSLKSKCNEWGTTRGKLVTQLSQIRNTIPTKEEYE